MSGKRESDMNTTEPTAPVEPTEPVVEPSAPAEPTNANERKLVPESDLIAVKNRYEKEKSDLEQQLNDLKQKSDSNYQATLQGQVDADKQSTELEAVKQELEQLRGDAEARKTLEEKVTTLETQLLETTKQNLSKEHGVDVVKLEGKTLAELKVLEEAIQLVGTRASRNYDTGATPGTSTETLTSKQKIKQGLMERR